MEKLKRSLGRWTNSQEVHNKDRRQKSGVKRQSSVQGIAPPNQDVTVHTAQATETFTHCCFQAILTLYTQLKISYIKEELNCSLFEKRLLPFGLEFCIT